MMSVQGQEFPMVNRLLGLQGVKEKTGLSHTTIYDLEGRGLFPKRVSIPGTTRVAWREADIDAWISELPFVGKGAA